MTAYGSAFEAQVADALADLGIAFEHQPQPLGYFDREGACREYRPDLRIGDVLAEVKGRLDLPGATEKLLAVKEAHPSVDLRVVFQEPFRELPDGKAFCEWAEENGFPWGGLPLPGDWVESWKNRQGRMQKVAPPSHALSADHTSQQSAAGHLPKAFSSRAEAEAAIGQAFAAVSSEGCRVYWANDPTRPGMDTKGFAGVLKSRFRYQAKSSLRWLTPSAVIGEVVPVVDVRRFWPGWAPICERDGALALNLWRAPAHPRPTKETEPAPFQELLKHLLDDDEAACQHVTRFFAHAVQKPGERINHALLITSSQQGVGKSTLARLLEKLVGKQNAGPVQTRDLKSNFDGAIINKLVATIDEVYEAGNFGLADKMKSYITEDEISVNLKGLPEFKAENYTRWVLFSNNPAPLPLEENDRRFWVWASKAKRLPQDQGQKINDMIHDANAMGCLYWWLMAYDLDGFNPKAPPPMTPGKQDLIGNSTHPITSTLSDWATSGRLHKAIQEQLEGASEDAQRLYREEGAVPFAVVSGLLGQARIPGANVPALVSEGLKALGAICRPFGKARLNRWVLPVQYRYEDERNVEF